LRYIKSLTKPAIIVGDLNISHTELDVYDEAAYKKYTEVHAAERASYNNFLTQTKLVDSFRHFNPSLRQYTYWTQKYRMRDTDRGWRSDFGLIDPQFLKEGVSGVKITDSQILGEVMGSDHCPIKLSFSFEQ